MLTTVLASLAALLAGLTGTWSPCGFSMIETLASPRSGRGKPVVVTAAATFLAGALAGGVVTFGVLSLLGAALGGPGGRGALAAGALIGALAAAGELAGVRVVPQIRRQVPEPWRRRMALPLVAALYGGLLGLGFTTFVLTFGVWALALICIVLGSPATGFAVGLAFGLGRALPVVTLICAGEGLRVRALVRMAERPALLRAARLSDGLALGALSLALALGALTGTARAASAPVVPDGRDPSAAGPVLAWLSAGGEGVTRALTPARSHDVMATTALAGRALDLSLWRPSARAGQPSRIVGVALPGAAARR